MGSFNTCPFCKQRPASKKSSHIVTNFLTHSMKVSPKGNKLYALKSEPGKVSHRPTQDSPKEDYIFCPECESEFNNRFERHVANYFYYNHTKRNNFFTVRIRYSGIVYRVFTEVNYMCFQKFWLLQLYRAHISKLPEFSRIKLPKQQLDIVYKNLIDETYFKDIRITIFSTALMENKSGNILFAVANKKQSYTFWMNEFVCVYQFNEDKPLFPQYVEASNFEINSPRIIYIDLKSWKHLRQIVFDLAINNAY